MRQAFARFAAYIKAETLSTTLLGGQIPLDTYREQMTLDGEKLWVAITKERRAPGSE